MNQIGRNQVPPTEHRRAGVLVEWNDKRGFGWVEGDGQRLFAHIKEFRRGQRRPEDGDRVTFLGAEDESGRPRARDLVLVRAVQRVGILNGVLLGCLLVLPLGTALVLPIPVWSVPAAMLVSSLISFWLYRGDKAKADAGEWRTPEATLHLWELVGGWPGAFLAQRRYRHKTRKLAFQVVYWGIVALYQVLPVVLLAYLERGGWLP